MRGNKARQFQRKFHRRARRDSSSSTACIKRAVKFDGTGASGRRESNSRNSFWIGSFFIVCFWLKTGARRKLREKTRSPSHGLQRILVAKMTAVSAEPATATAPALTNRQRFLAAARCQPVDRPPVWLMRQAGRALPEYRKLKEKYTFVQLVQNSRTRRRKSRLQPVRRFGFDAAILFSDILVIPEAMGQTYHFKETGGVRWISP